MLNDRRERPTPTLDDVRPNLSEGLQRAAVDAQVDEWLQNADIERMTLDIDPSLIRDIDLLNDD
jgi:peptidyl-prolyl cis-trans isomerase C